MSRARPFFLRVALSPCPGVLLLPPSSFILARGTVFAVKILSVFLMCARGRPLQGLNKD